MSSDRRWSGGAANREWQRGTRQDLAADPAVLAAKVAEYLADCAALPRLDPRYHPTEAGALKLIFHVGKAQEDAIRSAYRTAVQTTPESAA